MEQINDIIEIEDPILDLENDEINWDAIRDMAKKINDKEIKKLYCKKCDAVFYCENYHGKFPLCEKHRHNTFKSQ